MKFYCYKKKRKKSEKETGHLTKYIHFVTELSKLKLAEKKNKTINKQGETTAGDNWGGGGRSQQNSVLS